jgi:hypothetical protein
VSQGLQKRRHLGKLFASLPIVFLLEIFWALGEFIGYVTRKTSGERKVSVQVAAQ